MVQRSAFLLLVVVVGAAIREGVALTTGVGSHDADAARRALPPEADAAGGIPLFVIEPKSNYYIVKNKAVTVSCKASPAVQINFKCAGQWVLPNQHRSQELVDPNTGIKYLETSIEVARSEVVEYFGLDGYWCECHAWNSDPMFSKPKTAKSARGRIQLAFLRRRFEREPISTSAALQSSVQLQCLPPSGQPAPRVFWLKNGVQIDDSINVNFIISNEGNLIINQARIEDAGNYTCGAQNMASRRLSSPATLSIYVNGDWSTWSQWSSCTSKCGKGTQRRSRHCDSPSPKNRGKPCQGPTVQKISCTSVCPVDGYWSTWSSWSTCSPDCRYHRRRLCDSPAPANGGRYCIGSDLNTNNCTGGMCRDVYEFANYGDNGGMSVHTMEEQSVAMYAGLIVAIAVFITVIIVIIVLLRRKSARHSMYEADLSGTDSSSSNSSGGLEKKLHKPGHDLLVQPDITQTVVTLANQHAQHDSPAHHCQVNNNSADKTTPIYCNTDTLVTRDNSKNQLIELPPSTPAHIVTSHSTPAHVTSHSTPSHVTSHSTLLHTYMDPHKLVTSSVDENCYSELPAVTSSPQHQNRQSVISCHLPSNIDYEALAWCQVGSAGGRISLPDSGLSLTVPEGALKTGSCEDMFIAVCRDDKDRPRLSEAQTVLSPVILVGPPEVSLKKPLVVSFPHCASVKHGQWCLSVHSSDTAYDEPPQWQHSSTLGQETINTPLYVQLDANWCHVVTEQTGRLALLGEPVATHARPVKLLRLAAFAPAAPSGLEFSIRVYVLEDTQDALEAVLTVESRMGGRLLDKPRQMLFQYGGGNLCCSVDELATGWRLKGTSNYQEIPGCHVWSGNQSTLHCSLALERLDRQHSQFSASVAVFQDQDAAMNNRQQLRLQANLQEDNTHASPAHLPSSRRNRTKNSTVSATGLVQLEPPQKVFRLSSHVRAKLCSLLDPPNARGNDWRMLAQRLSVDRYINYFATKSSPTEHILDLWEARHRENSAITDLMNSLRVMGRQDAAGLIEKELGAAWL